MVRMDHEEKFACVYVMIVYCSIQRRKEKFKHFFLLKHFCVPFLFIFHQIPHKIAKQCPAQSPKAKRSLSDIITGTCLLQNHENIDQVPRNTDSGHLKDVVRVELGESTLDYKPDNGSQKSPKECHILSDIVSGASQQIDPEIMDQLPSNTECGHFKDSTEHILSKIVSGMSHQTDPERIDQVPRNTELNHLADNAEQILSKIFSAQQTDPERMDQLPSNTECGHFEDSTEHILSKIVPGMSHQTDPETMDQIPSNTESDHLADNEEHILSKIVSGISHQTDPKRIAQVPSNSESSDLKDDIGMESLMESTLDCKSGYGSERSLKDCQGSNAEQAMSEIASGSSFQTDPKRVDQVSSNTESGHLEDNPTQFLSKTVSGFCHQADSERMEQVPSNTEPCHCENNAEQILSEIISGTFHQTEPERMDPAPDSTESGHLDSAIRMESSMESNMDCKSWDGLEGSPKECPTSTVEPGWFEIVPGTSRQTNHERLDKVLSDQSDDNMETESAGKNDPDFRPFDDSDVSDSDDSECFDSDNESIVFPVYARRFKPICKEIANSEVVTSPGVEASTSKPELTSRAEASTSQSEATSTSETKTPYIKPYRMCIFCNKLRSKLSQHIKEKHSNKERVQRALELPKKERDLEFDMMKKEGIMQQNIKQAKEDKPKYTRERTSKLKEDDSALFMCGTCNGFYSRRYIKRHTKRCITNTEGAVHGAAIPASLLKHGEILQNDQDFATEILSRFRQNIPCSKLCRSDRTIIKIGQRMWRKEKKKQNKKAEVRKAVMSDMRRLSNLYIEVLKTEEFLGVLPSKEGDASDLFKRNNFQHLEEAIEVYTSKQAASSSSASESRIKPGLKLGLYYLLKSASKIMKGLYLCEADEEGDAQAADIDKFTTVLEVNHDMIFGDAEYCLNQAREKKLRRPESQPTESDIQKVRDYTVNRITELVSDEFTWVDVHNYTELRDLVICRLTLFNARRGGEPSRLKIEDWIDADEGAWLDKLQMKNLDPIDQALSSKLKVSYQSGKGVKHLVPVLFPGDTHAAMRLLADPEARKCATVAESNKFMFPSTGHSENHMSGWHALNNVCEGLELENRQNMTATKNRHFVSSKFSIMDVSEQDRQYIYKHLGHSEETNKHIYQAPLAIKALTVVGKRLMHMDDGM